MKIFTLILAAALAITSVSAIAHGGRTDKSKVAITIKTGLDTATDPLLFI